CSVDAVDRVAGVDGVGWSCFGSSVASRGAFAPLLPPFGALQAAFQGKQGRLPAVLRGSLVFLEGQEGLCQLRALSTAAERFQMGPRALPDSGAGFHAQLVQQLQ